MCKQYNVHYVVFSNCGGNDFEIMAPRGASYEELEAEALRVATQKWGHKRAKQIVSDCNIHINYDYSAIREQIVNVLENHYLLRMDWKYNDESSDYLLVFVSPDGEAEETWSLDDCVQCAVDDGCENPALENVEFKVGDELYYIELATEPFQG